jgi:hypothetical protein
VRHNEPHGLEGSGNEFFLPQVNEAKQGIKAYARAEIWGVYVLLRWNDGMKNPILRLHRIWGRPRCPPNRLSSTPRFKRAPTCASERLWAGADWTQRSAQTEATLGRSEPSRAAMTVSAASALAG